LSTTLSTRMTGISLHIQWPLTSQSQGSILKENNRFFAMCQTQRPSRKIEFKTTINGVVGMYIFIRAHKNWFLGMYLHVY
jgi:hypothetical protein